MHATIQRSLFDEPPIGSSTRRRAAEAAEPSASSRAGQVLDHLRRCPDGATRDELAQALGLAIQSICPVVHQLLGSGRIAVSDQERLTRLGRPAEVLVIRTEAR